MEIAQDNHYQNRKFKSEMKSVKYLLRTFNRENRLKGQQNGN